MELLASGRASAVYALDERTVLRRSGFDIADEARLMRYLRQRGYPVPEVYAAEGREMRMERVHGPTLANGLVTGRVEPGQCAELIRGLHDDLHRIEPPIWLTTEVRGVDLTGSARRLAVLHLDLHPENILLSEHGPQVIDWTNAAAGDPEIDLAVTWAIFAGEDATLLEPELAEELHHLLDALSSDLSLEALTAAVAFREADANLDAAELQRMRTRAAAKFPSST
ncbi:phosphotransferase [Microbacterium sp. NPDC056234]|uniref:phosphotransferase n=1 Tax=Microbacterium sp. NPDC056234 TaxID=3345757 RepID=UPI0035DB8E1E